MARMPRVVVPGYPHHVTQRGNRKQQTFFCEDDYRFYLRLLSEQAKNAGTEIWAYCLLPNHVHLVMVPGKEDGLRAVLSEVHRRYTRFINIRGRWCGHLWQERYHSFIMDDSYLLATVRYVERNPVAARLCDHPDHWQWSSAIAHVQGRSDGCVKVEPMLGRVDNWRDYLADDNTPRQEIELIKTHTRTGRPLGDQAFVRKLEKITNRRLMPGKAGRKPAEKATANCSEA